MNTAKTFLLMVVMSALLLLVGALLGGIVGIIVAMLLAVVRNFSAYWFADRIALKMTKAVPITENDDPELESMSREQDDRAGRSMHQVLQSESE